jgi:hypothetical protein
VTSIPCERESIVNGCYSDWVVVKKTPPSFLGAENTLSALSLSVSLWYWGLNLRFHVCWAGTLQLEPFLQPFCSGYFGDGVRLFAQRGLDPDPPVLHFLP